MNISRRTKEVRPIFENSSFTYTRKIYEASCANPRADDEDTIKKKIRSMWSASRDSLNCNSVQFDVPAGNILKYAVAMKFNEFLEDAIFWGVDLNWIDAYDRRTVLDYVEYHIGKNKGKPIESTLRYYREILLEAGAKRSSEINSQNK